MTLLAYCRLAAITLCLTACATVPEPLPPQPSTATAACKAGGDARGITAGFFALFQDAPECFRQ